jgi:hypothetical protein
MPVIEPCGPGEETGTTKSTRYASLANHLGDGVVIVQVEKFGTGPGTGSGKMCDAVNPVGKAQSRGRSAISLLVQTTAGQVIGNTPLTVPATSP